MATPSRIPAGYEPKHPWVWTGSGFPDAWIDARLLAVLRATQADLHSLAWIVSQPHPGMAARAVYRRYMRVETRPSEGGAGWDLVHTVRPRPDVPGVFVFPCVTKEFASAVVAELDALQAFLHRRGVRPPRPNTMNRGGLVLASTGVHDLGLASLVRPLVAGILSPLAAALFEHDDAGVAVPIDAPARRSGTAAAAAAAARPAAAGDASHAATAADAAAAPAPAAAAPRTALDLDPSGLPAGPAAASIRRGCGACPVHAFTVDYLADADGALALHKDVSDVTMNVSLGAEFEGGDLLVQGWGPRFLSGRAEDAERHRRDRFPVEHVTGTALMHLGSHPHMAEPVTAGRRVNLIIWRNADEAKEVGRRIAPGSF